MSRLRGLFLVALALVSVFAVCSVAQARSRYSHRGYHSNYRSYHHNYRGYGRSGYSALARANAELIRANVIRAAAVRAAQAEARDANSALTRTRTKIQREFKYSPQLTAAEAALDDAHRELERARSGVRDRLGSDPAYLAAKRANDGALVETMQLAAYRKDADAQDAQEVVYRAAARVSALKKQFEASVTSDPQWLAASKRLSAARANVSRAQAAGNKVLAASGRKPHGRVPHR